MNFGEKLQQLRKSKSLSQEMFAQELNVSRQAVSKWETGEGKPELDKLIQISEYFGVTLDYLVKNDVERAESLVVVEEEVIVEEINKPFSDKELAFDDLYEVEDKIDMYINFGKKIGTGVMTIIMGVGFTCIFENAEWLGGFLMMICIGIGVAIIVIAGINYSNFEKLDVILNASDHNYFMAEYDNVKVQFAKKLAFGIAMILFGVALVMLMEGLFGNDDLGSGLMLFSVGIGVNIIVRCGIELDTYKKILGIEED